MSDDEDASAYASSQASVSDDEWDDGATPKSGKKRALPKVSSAGARDKGKKVAASEAKGTANRRSSTGAGGEASAGGRRKKATQGNDSRIHEAHDFSVEEVMAAVHALKATMGHKAATSSGSSSSGSSSKSSTSSANVRGSDDAAALALGVAGALEVREQAPPEVMSSIEKLVMLAAERILGGESFELAVPSRTAANQVRTTCALAVQTAQLLSARSVEVCNHFLMSVWNTQPYVLLLRIPTYPRSMWRS
jgi:hypothetical protein